MDGQCRIDEHHILLTFSGLVHQYVVEDATGFLFGGTTIKFLWTCLAEADILWHVEVFSLVGGHLKL